MFDIEDKDPETDGRSSGVTRVMAASHPVWVVALGASAGGVEALQAFFRSAREPSGLAYVVLMHMAVDVHSHLVEVLQTCTSMPVQGVSATTTLLPDHVYVLMPGTTLEMASGCLVVIGEDRHQRPSAVIDRFFASLAEEQGRHAIGVVLSGSGADGSAGLVAIQRAGGVCLIQAPASAVCPSMPERAMAAVVADQVLPPAQLAAWLAALPAHREPFSGNHEGGFDVGVLRPVFDLLKKTTGHDFSAYKPTTLSRRIRRRMALSGVADLTAYVSRLVADRHEIERLFDDLLINVTQFFRDPATFDVLRDEIVPGLLQRSELRIWVPACSTGEEVYSLAMLLHARMESMARWVPVRIFGTDIDTDAIVKARAGIFPDTALRSVPDLYRNRYFSRVEGGSRIAAAIRQMCVFAEQDLIRDPPFSRLDMVCCRNVMIYMDPSLQQKVFALFRFALRPGGILVLGAAESNARGSEQFSHLNVKHKIYVKRTSPSEPSSLPPVPASVTLPDVHFVPVPEEFLTMTVSHQQEAERYLIARYAPASLIVDAQLNITGFFGDVAPFIQPVSGAASFRLVKMARPELVGPLGDLIAESLASQAPVQWPSLVIEIAGRPVSVTLRAVPLSGASPPAFLVVFECGETLTSGTQILPSPDSTAGEMPSRSSSNAEAQLRFLRDEVHRLRNEKVSVGEELQAANEEIQSTNEELQSTNEELESAKEELQSTNEELTSINVGLSAQLTTLTATRDDLLDILTSLDMPLVLLSDEMRILRFTPAARPLLNVIDGDVGRPLSHVRPNVELAGLEAVCAEVLESHAPQSMECRTVDGVWYSLTIRPHVTAAGTLAGLLLVFVNLSGLRLEPSYSRWFSQVSRDADDIVTLIDDTGRFITWSEKAEQRYGYTETEALRISVQDMIPEPERTAMALLLKSAGQGHAPRPARQTRIAKSGVQTAVVAQLTAMYDTRGHLYAYALTDSPVDKWTRHLDGMTRMLAAFDQIDESFTVLSTQGDVVFWGESAEKLYGYAAAALLGRPADLYWTEPVKPAIEGLIAGASTDGVCCFSARRKTRLGEELNVTGRCCVLHAEGQAVLLAIIEKRA